MIAQDEFRDMIGDKSASSLKKYMALFVGETSYLSLLRYELITSLFGPLPGALGLVSRKLMYRFLLGQAGRGTVFGRNIILRNPGKISLGNNCIIDDNAVLDAKGTSHSGIIIGNGTVLNRNVILSCKGGGIKIGENTNLGINTAIHSEKQVTIGNNVLVSAFCYIVGSGPHKTNRLDIPIIQQGVEPCRGITIEDGVWLGADVKILDGVTIGKDSIIGAGAVVTKDIPPLSIAVGIPAKVIRQRNSDSEPVSG
jgi:acetyltransferase-like isoleucine patch superfamily enzyme